VPPAPVRVAAAPAAASATFWEVQLGAYVGRDQAEAAWSRMRARAPALGRFEPRYQPVPDRPSLVRLRLAVTGGRDDAERLCRQAVAAGVDCRPVGRG